MILGLRHDAGGEHTAGSVMTSSGFLSFIRAGAARIIKTPTSLLELLQYALLTALFLQLLIGFGGFTPYARPMQGVLVTFTLLSAVHLLWMMFGGQRRSPSWEWLLPLPFLAWAALWGLAGASTEGRLQLLGWAVAYGVFVILCNSLHNSRRLWAVVFLLIAVVFVALMGAFFQYYVFPQWVVTLERERPAAYLGGAAGFFMEPLNLAALLVATFPMVALIAFMRRLSGPVRMFCGFMVGAMLVGLLLSGNLLTGVSLLVYFLLLPFFISRYGRFRWRFWGYGALILVLLAPLIWFGTTELRDRVILWTSGAADPVASASVQAAWSVAQGHLMTGTGLGRFGYFWEAHRPEALLAASHYPANSYAAALAEVGLLGLCLLLFPALGLLALLFKRWMSAPHLAVSKDVRSRMDRMGRGHPGRLSLERQHGRAPTAKLLGGAVLLGCLGLAIQLWGEASLWLPFLGAVVALYCALALCLGRTERVGSRWLGYWTAALPALVAAALAAGGASPFMSQHLVYTSDEHLEFLLADEDRIFMNPRLLGPVMGDYALALEIYPRNAAALEGLGRSHLGRLAAEMDPPAEIAMTAIGYLERALSLEPRLWKAHFGLARARLITGQIEAAESHLRMARELAPAQVGPTALLGLLLLLEGKTDEGQRLLQRAKALDPDYAALASARRRIDLLVASGRRAGPAEYATLGTQIGKVVPLRERVLWAGVPAWRE